MQNNLIPQISHGCMEMKGEERNIRMARGSNENAVEEKMNKEKQVCTRKGCSCPDQYWGNPYPDGRVNTLLIGYQYLLQNIDYAMSYVVIKIYVFYLLFLLQQL